MLRTWKGKSFLLTFSVDRENWLSSHDKTSKFMDDVHEKFHKVKIKLIKLELN